MTELRIEAGRLVVEVEVTKVKDNHHRTDVSEVLSQDELWGRDVQFAVPPLGANLSVPQTFV